jgi:hypothetical protein
MHACDPTAWLVHVTKLNHYLHKSYHNAEGKEASAATFKGIRKDMDLRRQLKLGSEASRIQEQMKTDVAFLLSQGVMDYSLFVAIHNVSETGDGAAGAAVIARGESDARCSLCTMDSAINPWILPLLV